MFFFFCFLLFLDLVPGMVWIMGHSYVCWGARRGDARFEGRQLGFSRWETYIKWLGIPGMLWGRLV